MVYFLYSTAAACMNICYDSYPSAKVNWYQLSIYSNRAVNYKTLCDWIKENHSKLHIGRYKLSILDHYCHPRIISTC